MTYITNEQLARFAAEARADGRDGILWRDLLTARIHANMPYTAAQQVAERKIEDAGKAPAKETSEA